MNTVERKDINRLGLEELTELDEEELRDIIYDKSVDKETLADLLMRVVKEADMIYDCNDLKDLDYKEMSVNYRKYELN